MITRDARTYVKDYLKQNIRYKIGTGGDSTNPNATDLDAPLDTTLLTGVTVNDSGESTIDYSVTVSGSTYLGQTIKEIGIFSTTNNTLIVRVNYDGIGPLTATDEIEFLITLEVD
tara:strand:+ start:1911 stop:2255 length:345 start_codon:yes stop_codon:yes gene_type:complete